MATDIGDAVSLVMQEKGVSEELVLKTVEDSLIAAYKRKFDNAENAVVRFSDDNRYVSIFARKKVVDGVFDPSQEIELEEAKTLSPDAEEGDELLIELNPRDFDRIAVQNAKQIARQDMREITKNTLYSEYKDKVGEIIIGYYQREHNGTIYVDLGKTEGILPRKYQSPRETYHVNDRIKALIAEVNPGPSNVQIILSRTHADFVKAIFELEVPEIYDKTVEIHKIVREPGYRTKIAVYSSKSDVDPVGACVGLKGARIQAIVRELEGEKIDILKYDNDARTFIKNALSPAQVKDVIILDEAHRRALAVVEDNQLSLAIGKQGLNVRLANRLCDWSIDVKTQAQFDEMDIRTESQRQVDRLFGETGDAEEQEINRISELPGVDLEVAAALQKADLDFIEDFLALSSEQQAAIPGVTAEQLELLQKLIDEYVEVVDEEGGEEAAVKEEPAPQEDEAEGEYFCPNCGAKITLDMDKCPNCGVELSFEYADNN
jgi:N utilization substance protein A